jgi:hypothetical protein
VARALKVVTAGRGLAGGETAEVAVAAITSPIFETAAFSNSQMKCSSWIRKDAFDLDRGFRGWFMFVFAFIVELDAGI